MAQTSREQVQEPQHHQAGLVRLRDAAHLLGGSEAVAIGIARAHGATILQDWDGAPAISLSDAMRVRAEYAAQIQKNLELAAKHEQWTKEQQAAFMEKLRREAEERHKKQEAELARLAEEDRIMAAQRHAQQQQARREEQLRHAPDTSLDAYLREHPEDR